MEAKPSELDLVLLLDRSVSAGYALGSESATPASAGQISRWALLTTALDAFLSTPEIASSKVSLTFCSYSGSVSSATECNSTDYARPVVALDAVTRNQTPIMSAMQAVSTGGLSPIVPAMTGTLQYAMVEQRKEPQREKAVVYVGDGFPSLCDQKAPTDLAGVISEAATALTPIRTFIVGFGSPETMAAAKFNLLNYASAGKSGKPPFVMDETAGADGVKDQLVSALLEISTASARCSYRVSPLSPDLVSLTYRTSGGDLREIPRVSDPTGCGRSPHGGWYFDNPTLPTSIRVCPCTCSNLGSGQLRIVHGCAPSLVVE